MGSRLEEDGHPDDYRQHQLELPDYYLGRVPVTVAQFRSYVTAAQPHLQGNPDLDAPANHPVVTITWNEALAYCGWLEGRLREMGQERLTEPSELCTEELLFWRRLLNEGWRVTLPSEAEWEKAARGPLAPPPYPPAYPCGPDFGPDCANLKETGLRTTSAVGCFPRDRGAYGPLDLTGNVREWTRSHFMSYHRLLRLHHYLPWDGREAIGAGNHVACITRGSSYDDDLRFATYTDRNGVSPECFALHDGFRVAVVSHIFVWERRNLWLLFQHPNKARQRPGR
jgi:iron(II)-dependent oxidoreductase